jgi:hypothetical protein
MAQTTETGDRYQGAGVSWGAILNAAYCDPDDLDYWTRELSAFDRKDPRRALAIAMKHALLADGFVIDGELERKLAAATPPEKVTGLANDWMMNICSPSLPSSWTRERSACVRERD